MKELERCDTSYQADEVGENYEAGVVLHSRIVDIESHGLALMRGSYHSEEYVCGKIAIETGRSVQYEYE